MSYALPPPLAGPRKAVSAGMAVSGRPTKLAAVGGAPNAKLPRWLGPAAAAAAPPAIMMLLAGRAPLGGLRGSCVPCCTNCKAAVQTKRKVLASGNKSREGARHLSHDAPT